MSCCFSNRSDCASSAPRFHSMRRWTRSRGSGTVSPASASRCIIARTTRTSRLISCSAVLRHLGRLGVSVAVLDWLPANTFTTATVERRGYQTREFNLADFRAKVEKQKFERKYSEEEIWEAFAYYLKRVLPVAGEANVKLAMHPSDPPVIEKMNGVGRIFRNYEGYRRAEGLAGNSKHWGVRLCVGTWSEGGDQM